jgi:hypothetical protein
MSMIVQFLFSQVHIYIHICVCVHVCVCVCVCMCVYVCVCMVCVCVRVCVCVWCVCVCVCVCRVRRSVKNGKLKFVLAHVTKANEASANIALRILTLDSRRDKWSDSRSDCFTYPAPNPPLITVIL